MVKCAAVFLLAALGAPAADQDLLKLAMPDARVVAGVNATQVKGSPFGQFLLTQAAASQNADFEKFVTTTGFDPRRDLVEILFASPGGANESRRLVLARGTFALSSIAAVARGAGAQITSYKGVDVIEPPQGKHGALAFLDDSLAIAGDLESVQAAIDRSQAGQAQGLSGDLLGRINALSQTQDAWFVSLVPLAELANAAPAKGPAGLLNGNAVQSITQANGGVKFTDPVRLTSEIVTGSQDDAGSLANLVRTLVGLAGLQQPKSGPGQSLVGLLNALELSTQGASLKLGLSIPEQQLEAIVKQGHP